jgi:GNAT superfamily N-acetyltransferase
MLRLCSAESIRSFVERGDVYYVALHGSQIIGVAGIRDNGHLTHNFVDDGFHRQGISRELWQLATAECSRQGNQGSYNLRVSTYAIPVYKKWGFVQTGAADHEHGITSTQIALTVE